VRIDLGAFHDLDDDTSFSERLVQEQSVFVLPGKVRTCAGWRLCVCVHANAFAFVCVRRCVHGRV
jgi:hypothetical protein